MSHGFKKYNKKKEEVISLLKNINGKLKDENINEFINNKISNIEEDRFVISIFGHFSNGKSTLLNALMGFGDEILVEDELASTATITKLKAPNEPSMANKAEVIFSNGNKKIINITDIKKYSARNKEFEVEGNIKEVTLFLESEYLKNGVEIVDTPGFNSTYTVHTDVAKSFIAKSDASIYLFSYDKPGTAEEFNFLKYVNQYMNRIFFVLTKVDYCDNTENSIDLTIEDLRDKLLLKNVNIEDKEIYPISAKLAKEAIKEKSEEKNKLSRFDYFKDALANYLTSDDNLKDRLLEPLKSVSVRLDEERKSLQEQINACNKDNEELLKEIENKSQLLEEAQKELKEKKSHIKSSIRDSVKNVKRYFERANEDIYDEIKEQLDNLQSEFDVALMDFSSMTLDVYHQFMKKWDMGRGELEDDIQRLIEETIDDPKELDKIDKKLMNIIRNSLSIERLEVSDPKFEFKELEKLDRELEKVKKQYDHNREKLSKFRDDKKTYDILMDEKKQKERDIARLREEKEARLMSLGDPIPTHYQDRQVRYEDRKGILGGLAQILVGQKRVVDNITIKDETAVTFVKKQKEEIESKFEDKITKNQKYLEEKLKKEIRSMGAIDEHLADMEFDVEDSRINYNHMREKQEQQKEQLKNTIIRVTKSKYLGEIKSVCNEYVSYIDRFLDDQRKLLIQILDEALEYDRKEIEQKRNNIYDITSLSNKTPEELQVEAKKLYIKLEDITNSVKEIKVFEKEEF